jgi:hypothetical protein
MARSSPPGGAWHSGTWATLWLTSQGVGVPRSALAVTSPQAWATCRADDTRSVSIMSRLRVREVRVIVVNP